MVKSGITEATLAGIKDGGVDLTQWLEGFHHPEQSVLDTVANIKSHPLMPQDVTVRGFIMDSATGALTEIL
jgi:carbonic anhydrase